MYDYPCQIAIEKSESIDEGRNKSSRYYKCLTANRAVRVEIDYNDEQDVDEYIEHCIKDNMCSKCTYLHILKRAQQRA